MNPYLEVNSKNQSFFKHIFLVRSPKKTGKAGKELQVSEMLVPDRKRHSQMSIFLSVGHDMTTY